MEVIYTIVEGPTWEEAQANAEDLGGNLVSISSDEETQFLVDSFKDINLAGTNNLPIDEDIYWIGLTKESGAWEWSDGSELNYQQWGPLEPYEDNGADDRGEIVLEAWQGWANEAGNWNNSTSEINLRYGIAEIVGENAFGTATDFVISRQHRGRPRLHRR